MEDKKLIAKYIMEYSPIRIARKNWIKDHNSKPFNKMARKNWEIYEDEAEKAERLLKESPFAFLIAVILDQGKPTWKAWRGPYLIKKELKIRNFSPKTFHKLSQNTIKMAVKRAKLGCRNLPHEKAAAFIKNAARRILKEYSGKTSYVWEEATSIDELRESLIAFDGIGENLANMAIKIFLVKGMIPKIPKISEQLRKLQVKADIHVKKVLYRTGLSDEETEEASLAAAKKYCPSLPARIDSGAYNIGMEFCFKTEPNCRECPLYKRKNTGKRLCKRRINR